MFEVGHIPPPQSEQDDWTCENVKIFLPQK